MKSTAALSCIDPCVTWSTSFEAGDEGEGEDEGEVEVEMRVLREACPSDGALNIGLGTAPANCVIVCKR